MSLELFLSEIKDYKIIESIAVTNTGIIFKVINEALQRTEVLKLLNMENMQIEQDDIARFEREAQSLASLKRNFKDLAIPEIYDFKKKQTYFYYTMEYFEGECLQTLIDKEKITLNQAVNILLELATVLDKVHAESIVHRDIKPSNIIVGKDGHAYLVDFGIAKSTKLSTQANITEPGIVLGTLFYMAPEQLEGEITCQSDIYSLGAVLYEMLTLKTIIPEGPQDIMINQILFGEPIRPCKIVPSIPKKLENICLKAVEKSLVNRYNNVGDMQRDLCEFIEKYQK